MAKLDNRPAPGPWNDLDYDNIPAGFDWEAQSDNEQAALRELQERSDALLDGEIVGGLLHWSRGDGRAFYLVTAEKPLTLQWIPFQDRWQVEYALILGLRLEDIRQMLHRTKEFKKLFGPSRTEKA